MGKSSRFAGVFAIAAIIASAAQAAPHHVITPALPTVISERAIARIGAPDAGQQIHLAIVLPMRNLTDLKNLVAQIYDPKSPQYRHYLSVSEFADRFGPTAFDYQKAVAYFSGAGLRITGTSANHYLIDAVGSMRDVERIFHVKMGLYQHPTENRTFFAADREPTVDVDVPLLAVEGLDNFDLPKPRLIQSQEAPRAGLTGSGPGGEYIPSDIRAAYYGKSKLTGTGQSVGLMELEGYNLSDVQLLFKTVHQKLKPKIEAISVDSTPTTCHCNDGEQALDIDYAVGMAPNLTKVQVYVANSATSVLNKMASDNTSAQLSTSWGWSEHFATNDPLFLEMAAHGQTFLTASGDNTTLAASGPWPEEDANLTAVGGTDLVTQGPGDAWKSETAWKFSASGPTLDKTILIASYQKPFINVMNGGSKKLRNVSDISGDANFDNYICFSGKCEGGWGGTSFASPIIAGYIALANERAAQLGKGRVGFLNPSIYAPSTASVTGFHDVTSGKSGKFHATAGYDLVTGFGTPDGDALIQKLANGAK